MREHFEHPDWPERLRFLRENPDDRLARLVTADWFDENGFGERAAFVRTQCEGGSLLHVPGRLVLRWFTLNAPPKMGERGMRHWEPNTANVHDHKIRYYDVGTEGEMSGPYMSDWLQLRAGFAFHYVCRADSLADWFDCIYAREPVSTCYVGMWVSPGDRHDGRPLIENVCAGPNQTQTYRVCGQLVHVKQSEFVTYAREWLVSRDPLAAKERVLAEVLFGKRWPGVRFEVPAA